MIRDCHASAAREGQGSLARAQARYVACSRSIWRSARCHLGNASRDSVRNSAVPSSGGGAAPADAAEASSAASAAMAVMALFISLPTWFVIGT
jgi:hypothetical protein